MNLQRRLPAIWVVVLVALSVGALVRAEAPEGKTWSDGICTYDISSPLSGYFVPPSVFEKSYEVSLERVLAISRPMTQAELDAYTKGGKLKVTRDYPLFVLKNHRVNVSLWKGKHDGDQQIVPRYWTGEIWYPTESTNNRIEPVESLFFVPAAQEKCYVMIHQQNGQVGRDRIHTDYVCFGAFPSVEAVLRKGIKTASAVVYHPPRRPRLKGDLLDCLKGHVTRSELQKLSEDKNIMSSSFIFFEGEGKNRKIRSICGDAETYGTFRGKYGEFSLSVPHVKEAVAKDPSLKAHVWPGPLRWELARSAAGPKQKDAICRLRAVNPKAKQGEWVIVELTVGRDGPGPIYQQPQSRSGRDGGGALVGFRVRHGDVQADLAPQGRFGSDSFREVDAEENKALGIEYQFIDCGEGVLKLGLRPEKYPWSGTIEGRYLHMAPRVGRTPPVFHTSDTVWLELK